MGNRHNKTRAFAQQPHQQATTGGNKTRPFAPIVGSPIQALSDNSQVARKPRLAYDLTVAAEGADKFSLFQPKLTVGDVGDKYEQEADTVAAAVVDQIQTPQQKPGVVQRESMEEDELQMKPSLQRVGASGGAVPETMESQIQGARGKGQSLMPQLQAQMGQAMGADFSGVRIHTDSQSDQLNQSIQAKAFTTGQDLFFRQGAYEPGSRSGQELIAHELTHVVQQNSGVVGRSPQKNIVQREEEGTVTPSPSVLGLGGDGMEGAGNFIEFIGDTWNAVEKIRDGGSSLFEKVSSGGKALGGLAGTLLSALKANEIEKMTSCLEAFGEGVKIFDAGNEVWEAMRKVDFWQDTTMQTFENVAVVVGKLGDFILNAGKVANAFVSAMEWVTGKVFDFVQWLPLSELILKCTKFMTAVKQWVSAFISYRRLKIVQDNTSDTGKKQQVGYLRDEQWSRLKNGAVPIASNGVDFASETAKYFPSLGVNVAIAASLGTASKAVPFGHAVLTSGYDSLRQGWRNIIKTCASTNVAGYLAATDKADLPAFRNGLVTFVMAERNQTNGMIILESLGLGASVQTMGDPEAEEAIRDAVKNIK